ncbi:uncharacterized protein LOC129592278 [Paramacrobiotus metropolitanus]|uniref:uncharacterized protein LOC129592278 n=1 Tax=Paramacrobiotus metropolitanus TaxID=2943436 RepID=UPI002446217F|nr:uncharacterized protein LOC129592278 [Paramacrobiotus metropolitanus]
MSLAVQLILLSVVCAAVVSAKPPKSDCFSFETIRGKDGKSFQGEKNVGKCTCKQARDQALSQHIADKWVPACDDTGKFQAKQQDMVGAFCLDVNTGNQVAEKIITRQQWKVKCP